MKEPKADHFRLLVDLYELNGFEYAKPEEGKGIWIKVSQGVESSDHIKLKLKKNK